MKSQRKELLPGIHRWRHHPLRHRRRRINVLSQKEIKKLDHLAVSSCPSASLCGDCVRVPPLNLPVLPVAHCSRPIVNDPAIQHTHTYNTHIQGESEPPKKLAAFCHLPSALTPASCSWIRLLSWPFAQVSCLFMLRYPVNAPALWALSVSALSPVILPGVFLPFPLF